MDGDAEQWTPAQRWLVGWLPPAIMAVAAGVELLSPYSERVAGWPFAMSLLVVGMPHGAADLAVSRRMGMFATRSSALRFVATYSAGMVGAFALLWMFPLATLGLFAALSAWHFGSADHEDLAERCSKPATNGVRRASWVAARGSLILAVPFAARPAEATRVVVDVVTLVGGKAPTLDPDTVALTATCVVGGALAVWASDASASLLARRWRSVALDAVETLAIFLAAAVLHPLFSVGMYFVAWHSWRHTRRLVEFVAGERVTPLRSLLASHRASLPLLLPTIAATTAVAWWLAPERSVWWVAIVAIAAYVVVTPSHHMLVERMHARRRVARGDRPAPDGVAA
ncbi:MAG: Brp/Blh family beta-carotene 15,15'-dioxygenase [Lacipirellulaceae bacterium]